MYNKTFKILLPLSICIVFFVNVLTVFSDDLWHHWKRGLQHVNNGKKMLEEERLETARYEFKAAYEEFNFYLRHPEDLGHMFGIAYFGMGFMHEAKKEYELAIVKYKKAIKHDLHPTKHVTGSAYLNMGAIYLKIKDYPKAVSAYSNAIEHKPRSGLAHYYLGLAYFNMGEFEKAEEKSKYAKKLGIVFTALSDKLRKLKESSQKKAE